jgi:hypothetical protein
LIFSEFAYRLKLKMARPYSDDLRRKLLEAHDKGNGPLAELAERFGMSGLGLEDIQYAAVYWVDRAQPVSA